MTALDVDRVLSTLDQQLPEGASVSWFDAGAPPRGLPSRSAAGATVHDLGPAVLVAPVPGSTDPASTEAVQVGEPAPAGAAPGGRVPSAPVGRLLAGLADVLARVGGDFAAGGTDLLVETPVQTVLVHHVGEAGALVVEAGKGLNLALVRRLVTNALEDAGAAPLPAEPVVQLPERAEGAKKRGGGIATAFPRRTPQKPVTDFGYVPEDAEVLRMLEQALSG